jgi:hypothetical protein
MYHVRSSPPGALRWTALIQDFPSEVAPTVQTKFYLWLNQIAENSTDSLSA